MSSSIHIWRIYRKPSVYFPSTISRSWACPIVNGLPPLPPIFQNLLLLMENSWSSPLSILAAHGKWWLGDEGTVGGAIGNHAGPQAVAAVPAEPSWRRAGIAPCVVYMLCSIMVILWF